MKIKQACICIIACILCAGCAQQRQHVLNEQDITLPSDSIAIDPNAVNEESLASPSQPDSNQINQKEISSSQEEDSTQLVSHIDDDISRLKIALFDNDTYEENSIGLSLEQLESMAINNHPEIQQSLADVSAVKGQQYQVTRKFNPVAGYQGQEIGNDGQEGQQGVFLNQTFVTANKLEMNGQIQGHLVHKSEWDWRTKELEIRNNVQREFYNYQGAILKLKLSKKLLNISNESTKIVQLLIDAGESKKSQLLQSEIQAGQSEIDVNAQEQNVQSALRKLIASVGTPGLEDEVITGALGKDFPEYDWDQLYQTVLNSNPALLAARAQVQSSNWAIRRAEVQKIPNLQTQLGVMYDTATLDTITSVQFGGALPVHDQNKGNIRSRYAEYLKAVQEIERLRLSLKTQLANAYQLYETNRIQTVIYQDKILPKAEESLKLISQGFEQGQDPYITLLISQKTYFQANQDYVDVLIRVNQGMADLRKLKAIE